MTAKFVEYPLQEPNYMTLTSYERKFPVTYWRQLVGDHRIVIVYTVISYVLLMIGGRRWMSSRPPFKLNGVLILWNVGIASGSALAFSRVTPEFFHVLLGENGFHNSICEWSRHNGATAFWTWVILIMKFVMLGDTVFIVLRKQNLAFLHWYHHIATFVSWYIMYYWYEPVQSWYAVMNTFVHTFLYTYYAVRTLKIRAPRLIPMFIVSIELLQMLAGLGLNIYTYLIMKDDPGACLHRNWLGLWVSFAIFIPFTFLFAKLFVASTLGKKKSMREGNENPSKKKA